MRLETMLAPIAGTVTLEQQGEEVEYEIATPDNLDALQIGYATNALTGQSLVGSGEGDWRATWLTIGSETLCGDPIFVDLADSAMPVLTATHGAGAWQPEQISRSLDDFVAKSRRVV